MSRQLPRFQATRPVPHHLSPRWAQASAPLPRSRDMDNQSALGLLDSYRAAGPLLVDRWDCNSFTGSALNRQNRLFDNVEAAAGLNRDEAVTGAELHGGREGTRRPVFLSTTHRSHQSSEGQGPVSACAVHHKRSWFQSDWTRAINVLKEAHGPKLVSALQLNILYMVHMRCCLNIRS